MKIPFWDGFSSPLVIEFEDILGVVKLTTIEEWDRQAQIEFYQRMTHNLLEHFQIILKKNEEMKKEEEKHSGGGASFSEYLIAKIVNNI